MSTPVQYRGIFTSEREDSRREIIRDDGIGTIDRIFVGSCFPVTPDNTIGEVSRIEAVTAADGSKARRAYFAMASEPSPMAFVGRVPCLQGYIQESETADGVRTVTKCLVTGIALMSDPVDPNGNLEVFVSGKWAVVTPSRTETEIAPKGDKVVPARRAIPVIMDGETVGSVDLPESLAHAPADMALYVHDTATPESLARGEVRLSFVVGTIKTTPEDAAPKC